MKRQRVAYSRKISTKKSFRSFKIEGYDLLNLNIGESLSTVYLAKNRNIVQGICENMLWNLSQQLLPFSQQTRVTDIILNWIFYFFFFIRSTTVLWKNRRRSKNLKKREDSHEILWRNLIWPRSYEYFLKTDYYNRTEANWYQVERIEQKRRFDALFRD